MPVVDFSKLNFVNKVSDYNGGAYMIECFATWCPPCKAQIPHLAEMTKKFPNVYIVSVSTEAPEAVNNLKGKMVKMAEYNVATDAAGEIQKLMTDQGVGGIPHCFIYDANDKMIASCHPGEAD